MKAAQHEAVKREIDSLKALKRNTKDWWVADALPMAAL
jgi:hypothetical protein